VFGGARGSRLPLPSIIPVASCDQTTDQMIGKHVCVLLFDLVRQKGQWPNHTHMSLYLFGTPHHTGGARKKESTCLVELVV
jgi:hypothetical protein